MIRGLLKSFYNRVLLPLKYKECKISSNIPLNTILGEGVIISKGVVMLNDITIGSHTFIGDNTRLEFVSSIGEYCSISHNVKIGLGSHPQHFISTSPVFYSSNRGYVKNNSYNNIEHDGFTVIENDVLISSNVSIIAGVKIGTGAIIGAGSVVTKDIPPYAVAVGVPAKVIKYRFNDEIIGKLLKSRWWERDINELLKYKELMDNPIKFLESIDNS